MSEQRRRELTPKYKIGAVVCYGYGPTALMMITSVIDNGSDHLRYYGLQYYGDVMGQYENQLRPATSVAIDKFMTDNSLRRKETIKKQLSKTNQNELFNESGER